MRKDKDLASNQPPEVRSRFWNSTISLFAVLFSILAIQASAGAVCPKTL